MIKAIFGWIRLCFFILIAALIFHNLTARWLLSTALRYKLGVPVTVESARVDFLGSQVVFRNLVIENPAAFPAGYIAKIPYLTLDLDSSAFFDGHLRFKKVEIDISDFQVGRAVTGDINWLHLKPLRNEKVSGKGAAIEHFVLTVRRASYRDFARTDGAFQVIAPNLDNRDYLGVHTLEDMVKLVSWECFKRMGMEKLGAGILDQVKEDLELTGTAKR